MTAFMALSLFMIGTSIYGFWISPRTKGNRLILQPGLMGFAVIALTSVQPYIPERFATGPVGFLIWVVGLGPLVLWWGYIVIRDLLALRGRR